MDTDAVTTVVGSGHHLPARMLEVAHTTRQLHSLVCSGTCHANRAASNASVRQCCALRLTGLLLVSCSRLD